MSISYAKLIKIMQDRGINSTIIKYENLIGQASWKKIKEGGEIDTRTIHKLCERLRCQPGELLEWVDDHMTNSEKLKKANSN